MQGALAWFDTQFVEGDGRMFRAICGGDEDAVKAALAAGEDPNQKFTQWHNSTPIQWCGGGGHIGCAILLMKAGANPFEIGVVKAAEQFQKKEFIDFLKNLVPLAFEAIREEDKTIQFERQDKPGLSYGDFVELANAKGGRLCTHEEAQDYINNFPLFDGENQWCAIAGKDGEKQWIQVGGVPNSKTGRVINNEKVTWGDNPEASITWNRVLLWKITPGQDAEAEHVNGA